MSHQASNDRPLSDPQELKELLELKEKSCELTNLYASLIRLSFSTYIIYLNTLFLVPGSNLVERIL